MAQTSLAVSIVSILKNYGEVPLDFLVQALDRQEPEILEALAGLEQEGISRREGETVMYVQPPRRLRNFGSS